MALTCMPAASAAAASTSSTSHEASAALMATTAAASIKLSANSANKCGFHGGLLPSTIRVKRNGQDTEGAFNHSERPRSVARELACVAFKRQIGPSSKRERRTHGRLSEIGKWELQQHSIHDSYGINSFRKVNHRHRVVMIDWSCAPSRPGKSSFFSVVRAMEGASGVTASDGASAPNTTIPIPNETLRSGDVDAAHRASSASEAADHHSSEKFEWKLNWYAVAVEADLDRRQPHAIAVLGRRFVLWWDGSRSGDGGGHVRATSAVDADGEWRAFLDQCPHRLAPLSEGRIDEQGRLQCSYHGWAFAGDGACKLIPQARKDGPEQRATSSPRACAVPFPTRTAHGVVFLWPDETSVERASRSPLPVPPCLEDPQMILYTLTGRDLPYGYEFLVENTTDPSHLPFSHHGVSPLLNRSNGQPLDYSISESGPFGFRGGGWDTVIRPMDLLVDFQAPSRFSYLWQRMIPKGEGEEAVKTATIIYVTPTMPGKSYLIQGSARSVKKPWFLNYPWLAWIAHFLDNTISDGDGFFLYMQEKNMDLMRKAGKTSWNEAYFMPTSADRFVLGFHTWLEKFGGGGVKWSEGVEDSMAISQHVLPREMTMDRYNSHTKKCQHCTRALNFAKAFQKALFVSSVVLLSVAACLSSVPIPAVGATTGRVVVLRVALAVLAVGAAVWGVKLNNFIQKFIYTGYNHALIP